MASSEPTVLLPYARSTDLRQLAALVHTLKLALPDGAKLIVVESDAALRYGQEALLLRLGASLVVHRGAPEARIPLMLGAVQAQQAQAADPGIGFETAMASVSASAESGRVPVATLVREAQASVQRASLLGVPNALLVGRPKPALTCNDALARLHLPRSGDLLSTDGIDCLVFLSSCPRASLESALAHVVPEGLEAVFETWALCLADAEILERLGRLPLDATPLASEAAETITPITPITPTLAAHANTPSRVMQLPEDFFSQPARQPLDIAAQAFSPESAEAADAPAEAKPLESPAPPELPEIAELPESMTRAQAVEASADSLHELFQRLSVHFDAQASALSFADSAWPPLAGWPAAPPTSPPEADRKSTRLNSSH